MERFVKTDEFNAVVDNLDALTDALVEGLNDLSDNKVDKIPGKGLSTEDYTSNDKTKLSGIAIGATENDTDANLKNRENHTGSQPATTITEDAVHRFATDAEKAIWSAKQNTLGFTPENVANKNAANGYAGLDAGGLVPSSLLPSYVDDVLEFNNLAAFPVTGETGKIYVAKDTNKTYRWGGSSYVEISASPGSTDAVTEGSLNLYFTSARVLATLMAGLTATAGTPTSSDNLLVALGKVLNFINTIASTIRGTVLTGLTAATTTAVAATDTLLVSIGKLQGQISNKAVSSDLQTGTDLIKIPTAKSVSDYWTWIKTQVQTFDLKITFTSAPRISSVTANHYLKVDASKDITGVAAIPAADVSESTTKRFLTDTERTTWNAKQAALSIATDAEMQTGTDNAKYVTPLRHGAWWAWAKTANTQWTLGFMSGVGNRLVQANSLGDISAGNEVLDGFVTDVDVITAITGATYNSGNSFTATISPADKFFYQGQMYKNGAYLYIAILDNTVFRITGA